MKLLAKRGGLAAIGLWLVSCGTHQAESQGATSGGTPSVEALAGIPSEPPRVGSMGWQGVEGTQGAVGAIQGFLPEAGDREPPPDLLEGLLEGGTFRSFSAMLLVTGLHEELTAGPHTVLVPNDRAFQLLSLERRLELFETGDAELMADLLRRHTIRGGYSAEDLAKAGELPTLAGTRLRIEALGGLPVIDGAQLLSSRPVSSGMLHEVDRVLLP